MDNVLKAAKAWLCLCVASAVLIAADAYRKYVQWSMEDESLEETLERITAEE